MLNKPEVVYAYANFLRSINNVEIDEQTARFLVYIMILPPKTRKIILQKGSEVFGKLNTETGSELVKIIPVITALTKKFMQEIADFEVLAFLSANFTDINSALRELLRGIYKRLVAGKFCEDRIKDCGNERDYFSQVLDIFIDSCDEKQVQDLLNVIMVAVHEVILEQTQKVIPAGKMLSSKQDDSSGIERKFAKE